MRLQGKTALVTGVASGFGTGIARTFAREGAKVVLMDLNGDGARSVAASIGDAATAVQGDVTSAEDLARAVETSVEFGAGSTSWPTMPAGPTGTSPCWRSPARNSTASSPSMSVRSS
ncbi:SDR family NAD(P)-dependent oxidoreductase [Azospirillum thiophilum]